MDRNTYLRRVATERHIEFVNAIQPFVVQMARTHSVFTIPTWTCTADGVPVSCSYTWINEEAEQHYEELQRIVKQLQRTIMGEVSEERESLQ